MTCHDTTINGPSSVTFGQVALYNATIVPPDAGTYTYNYQWTAPNALVATPTAPQTLITFTNPGAVAVTLDVTVAGGGPLPPDPTVYPVGLPVEIDRSFSDAESPQDLIELQDGTTFAISRFIGAEGATLQYSHPLITWDQAAALCDHFDYLRARAIPVPLPAEIFVGLSGDMLAIAQQATAGRSYFFDGPPQIQRSKNSQLVTVGVRLVARTVAAPPTPDMPFIAVSIQGPGQMPTAAAATYTAVPVGGAGPYTYLWDVGDELIIAGATISDNTIQNPLITFPGPGLYRVNVHVVNTAITNDLIVADMEVIVQ